MAQQRDEGGMTSGTRGPMTRSPAASWLSVLFSPGGLTTKAAQLLLEAGLLYLIAGDWRRTHHRRARAVGITAPG
jgi:hypothetical protein